MNYEIKHTTKYSYTQAVPLCQNVVCVTPRSSGGQTCLRHRLTIHPTPVDRSRRLDYFGNQIDYFAVYEAHRSLTITASSSVQVIPQPAQDKGLSQPWEQVREQIHVDRSDTTLDAYQFAFASPLVQPLEQIQTYVAPSFPAGQGIVEAVLDLTKRIHADFVYDSKATTVSTPLEAAFASRRGVCQDFAHIQIACVRSLGLAARYVSGYLRTSPPEGEERQIGADASHAWLSVYCGQRGWVDFDPTNQVIPTSDHITLAWGRDYSDVCPVKGTFVGGGHHAVSVFVDVTESG